MKLLYFFLFWFPLVSFTNPCLRTFELASLDHEKYSSKALEKAMHNLDYKAIAFEYTRLSKKDEKELFDLYKKGDQRAFQILLLSNVYMVSHVVKKWMSGRGSREDLFQEGMVGLLKALDKFDNKKGVEFGTYLYHAVLSRLINYTDRMEHPFPIKMNPQKYKIYKILKKQKHLESFKPFSWSWLKKFSDEHPEYSIYNIEFVLRAMYPPVMLDYYSTLSADKDMTLQEILPDKSVNIKNEVIDKIELNRIYKWAEKEFSDPINQVIVKEMIFSKTPKTFEEIGKKFSISKQAIEKRRKKIIKKIRTRFLKYN